MHTPLQLLLLLLFATPVFGQKILGHVLDAKSGLPVAHASVGTLKSNVGTTAGKDGGFTIHTTQHLQNDSLVISCVGYKTLKLPFAHQPSAIEIFLHRKEVVLEEVLVRKPTRQATLGWSKAKADFAHTTTGLNTQCAQLLTAPRTGSRLQSVTVALPKGLFSRQKNARFRIRIYDYDSAQLQPGADLCDSVIEVTGGGTITINMEKYRISLPQERFFVAIQWLLTDENKEMVVRQDDTTVDGYTYRPYIRMQRTKQGEGKTWMQMHNHAWDRFNYDSAITATVLY